MRIWNLALLAAAFAAASLAHAEGLSPTCEAYGQAAAAFARGRDAGETYAAQITMIRREAPSADTAEVLVRIANAIYNQPGSSQLTPEGALKVYAAGCQVTEDRIVAGGSNLETAAEVDAYLRGFKTFNGAPLKAVLAKIGVSVASIETEPLHPNKVRPGDREGDVALTLVLSGHVPKTAPCGLARWAHGGLPPAELVRRGSQFPLVQPDSDDPIVYWAATGKCSPAYAY